jgi:hypothetical protein
MKSMPQYKQNTHENKLSYWPFQELVSLHYVGRLLKQGIEQQ